MKRSRSILQAFHQYFGRITSSGSYTPEIDGIRFVAIFFVLLQHSTERILRRAPAEYFGPHLKPLLAFFERGYVGVSIFFALSGYILVGGLLKSYSQGRLDRKQVGRYFLRRVCRIEPPYVVAVVIIFIATSTLHLSSQYTRAFGAGGDQGPHLIATLLYLHNLIFAGRSTILPIAWSLEVEVQFYILAPAIVFGAIAAGKRSQWLPLAIVAVTVVASGAAIAVSKPYMTLLVYWFYFAAGILVAYAEYARPNIAYNRRLMDLGFIAGLAGLFLSVDVAQVSGIAYAVLNFVFCLFVIGGALKGDLARRALANPTIATIGGMCYSIYLVHLPVLEVVASPVVKVFRRLPPYVFLSVSVLVLLFVALFVSAIFFRLIERPFMNPEIPKKVEERMRTLFGKKAPVSKA